MRAHSQFHSRPKRQMRADVMKCPFVLSQCTPLRSGPINEQAAVTTVSTVIHHGTRDLSTATG